MPTISNLVYRRLLTCLISASVFISAYADDSLPPELDYLNLTLEQLGNIKISIATGNETPIEQAPAVATVITAQQIEASGARTLDEVLETVPGLHVSLAGANRLDAIYSIRGIHTTLNPHALMLVNGTPIQYSINGGRPILFRQPVRNIARIEVIRGPGSAIYGADAFSGVINIITKTARDIGGNEVGTSIGSFDYREAWFQTGQQFDQWDMSFSLNYQHSDGDDDRIIESDAQTGLDLFYGTSASLAPDPAATRYELLDTHLGFQHKNWTINLHAWQSKDAGNGVGGAQALDLNSGDDNSLYMADISYQTSNWLDNWRNKISFSYLQQKLDATFDLLPAGSNICLDADGNLAPLTFDVGSGNCQVDGNTWSPVTFTNGVKGNPGAELTDTTLELVNVFDGIANHKLRIAIGTRYQTIDTFETKNFGPGVLAPPFPGSVNSDLTDVSDSDDVFIEDTSRTVNFISLQDEWSINPNWFLVTGLRHDYYSDFGNTTNPRVALVWKTDPQLTTKLLYGSAFRAPSFGELGFQNNPTFIGNDELEPEKIDTIELSFNYRPTNTLQSTMSFFTYQAKDLIDYIDNLADNARDQDGYGLEWELGWEINNLWRVTGNFAWQHSEDSDTGETIADAPGHQLTVNSYWKISPRWLLGTQLNYVADRHRAADDSRDAIDDYTLVNLNLKTQNVYKDLDISLGINNLFDKDTREPSDASGSIPNDFPLEGRSIWLELRYQF